MRVPSLVIRELLVGVFGQTIDHMAGQRTLAHVGKRFVVDDVVVVAGAQQFQEVEAALRTGRAEPGEVVVAHLGAEAVGGFMTGAGIVYRDPRGAGKPGTHDVASLVDKAVLVCGQQTDDLALGDDDAQAAQQRHQSWYRGLRLMILYEHEATQFRSEVTINAGRQRRRCHLTVRSLPAFAAEIHHLRADHQILHHVTCVAFEP
jgi:hypothetical protein